MKIVNNREQTQHNQNKKKLKVENNGNTKSNTSVNASKDVDSIEEGKKIFAWVMDGVDVDEFMK